MRMNEFEYVPATDAVSTVPNLESSDTAATTPNESYQFRRDMLLVINSLNVATMHLKTLMQLLADDDSELCGEHYKTARDSGLTL